MPKRITADNDEEESMWSLIKDLPGELIVIALVLLIVVGSMFWGWVSELSVFGNKISTKTGGLQIPIEFILNYQTYPQVVYEATVIQAELEQKTVKSWNGALISEECVISAQINSNKVNSLVGTANAILSAARLPLQYQQRGMEFSKPVDCNNTDYSHKVYIEVTGAEGSGDLLYIRKSGFNHEEAFVTLPRNLYDLVLLSAVNQTQFEMPNYAQVGWYRGQKLAAVTYEVGDQSGLNAWVQSWLPVMQYAYGANLVMTPPITTEVEVVVGSTKVKVGEHRECTNRYKGNCRNFEMIPDYSYVPVIEMRQVTTVTYYIP